MQQIEINWQKIFESNPKGLLEWIGHFRKSNIKYDNLILDKEVVSIYCNNNFIDFETIKSLNAKALCLIFWLNEKGIHVSVGPVFDKNQAFIFDRRNENYYTYTVDGTWEIVEGAIEQHFNDYKTPLALGIEFAFKLLTKQ